MNQLQVRNQQRHLQHQQEYYSSYYVHGQQVGHMAPQQHGGHMQQGHMAPGTHHQQGHMAPGSHAHGGHAGHNRSPEAHQQQQAHPSQAFDP